MTRVYFAHPLSDYSTRFEAETVKFIESQGLAVENPNQPHHQDGYKARGMDHFMDVIKTCDAVVFESFPGGVIGSGVAIEAEEGHKLGKPLFVVERTRDGTPQRLLPVLNPPKIVASRDVTRELSRLYGAMPDRGRA